MHVVQEFMFSDTKSYFVLLLFTKFIAKIAMDIGVTVDLIGLVSWSVASLLDCRKT